MTQAPAIGEFTYVKKHLAVTPNVQRNFIDSSNDDDPEMTVKFPTIRRVAIQTVDTLMQFA